MIRASCPEDLPEILRLDTEAFPTAPYPYFVMRQYLASFPDFVLVLDDGAGLVGYLLSTPPYDAKSWLVSLAIAPGLRGLGLGRRLMTEVLRLHRATGARTVHLSVEPGNESAVALYRSLGFVPEPGGPRRDYFGPGEDRLLMTLTL